ncbi:tRNA1(Val) (adenine(37)-N6)-methyltransferase [Olivibacter domesticus]|uniref:tRNA1(Val) (adenine(37)-N6)-methyltransferase n=1 Tax=Olivibacter domesticus TaxID=407022 RepID=A0A1H7IQU9_OLID1|nr:methyltransferase [Olivibacter domesticus]SEK64829.1 tRNA1Val (adenine37-N6)-methyltransferase [Olivibacter domesticus]
MRSLFRFKQFDVDQTDCSMKINTDGVLLGALAEKKNANRILDIGTGTGVIALMMAQRYSDATIDAIDIDEQSSMLAQRNFKNSIFFPRINNHHISFQNFSHQSTYDLIVSNPPFFTNALKNPDRRKSNARHTSFEFYDQLLEKANWWLNDDGSIQLVLPPKLAEYIVNKAITAFGFKHQKTIGLRSFVNSEPYREIIALVKTDNNLTTSHEYLTLYKDKGVYSAAYKEILKPFFINF